MFRKKKHTQHLLDHNGISPTYNTKIEEDLIESARIGDIGGILPILIEAENNKKLLKLIFKKDVVLFFKKH
jgi:hypothetical protein